MLSRGASLAALAAIGCLGCESVPETVVSMIDHQRWEVVESFEDPFLEGVFEPVFCREVDYGVEGEGEYSFFEVVTTDCNYLTVAQSSLSEVSVGDQLELTLWHLPLVATEEGNAELIVTLGDRTIFTEMIGIPTQERVYSSIVNADFDAAAGALIHFHVHNHGLNAWRFYSFEVRR